MKASTAVPMNGETESLSRLSRNQSLFSLKSISSKMNRDPVVRHFEIHDLNRIDCSIIYRLQEDSSDSNEFEGNNFLLFFILFSTQCFDLFTFKSFIFFMNFYIIFFQFFNFKMTIREKLNKNYPKLSV